MLSVEQLIQEIRMQELSQEFLQGYMQGFLQGYLQGLSQGLQLSYSKVVVNSRKKGYSKEQIIDNFMTFFELPKKEAIEIVTEIMDK